ncbi:MAG: transglycosylase SLT domain-containing protein [Cytophagales bacterium]|jgi:membrane-bound lytic murein transglycosylase D
MKIGLTIFLALFYITNVFAEYDSTHQRYDYIPDANYAEIADRMGCLNTEIPLTFNKTVKSFIDFFSVRNRDYTRGVLEKKDYYFSIIEPYLEEYGLPDDLKYLAIVESGLVPRAQSRAGAVGLWQFMPSTGRSYGLSNSWYIDDRMDPNQATDAACRYLKSLYNTFGRWDLAIAAYNCGPGNVRKAIRRSGYKKDFWQIYRYLPRETRSYIPQFIAINYVLNYAEEHNLFPDQKSSLALSDTIVVSQYLHLATFAHFADIALEELLDLNPSIKRGVIPEGVRGFSLKVPADRKLYINAQRIFLYDTANKVGKEELEYLARRMTGSTYGRTKNIYLVRSGDNLGSIARHYAVRVSDIQKWNNLSSTLIRTGQNLAIWTLPSYTKSNQKVYVVANQNQKLSSVITGTTYQVRRGDSLWSISKNSNVSVATIKKINKLNSNTIYPGQNLIIGSD